MRKKIINPSGEIGYGVFGSEIGTLLSAVCMLVWTQIEGKVERTHLYVLRRSIEEGLKNNEIYQKKDN